MLRSILWSANAYTNPSFRVISIMLARESGQAARDRYDGDCRGLHPRFHRRAGFVEGTGLDAQRAAILAEAQRRGWHVVEVIEDAGYSGKDLKRPGIAAALEALHRRKADMLVVAEHDRLSRSMLDFAGLMAIATRGALGARRPRPQRRHQHSGRRGDGECPRYIRPVRAAPDL